MGQPTQPTTQVQLIQDGATVVPVNDADDLYDVTLPLTQWPDEEWEALFHRNRYKAPSAPESEVEPRVKPAAEGRPAINFQCSAGMVENVREAIVGFIEHANSTRGALGERQADERRQVDAQAAQRGRTAADLQDRLNRKS